MLLLLLISSVYAATSIAPENFDNLLQSSPSIQAIELESSALKSREVSRLSLFAPTIEVKTGVERFSIGTFKNRTQGYGSVEARINVFKSGEDLANFNKLKIESKRADAEAKAKQGDQLATLYELYYSALASLDKLKVLEGAIAINERHRAMAKRRLNAGLVTNTDLLDFNIYELKVKEQMIQERLALNEIEIQTRTLLGLERGSDLEWKTSSFTHKETLSSAGQRSEEIMRYALQAANNNTYIEKSWWKPKVDIVGSFAQLTQREEDFIFAKDRQEKVLAIELTFELDFASSPWKSGQEAYFSEQALAQTMRQQLLSVQENVSFIDEAHRLYTEQLNKIQEHSKIAKVHLKQTLEEYSRGVKNAPDVLGASERVVESELEVIEAKLTLNKVKAQKLRLSQL